MAPINQEIFQCDAVRTAADLLVVQLGCNLCVKNLLLACFLKKVFSNQLFVQGHCLTRSMSLSLLFISNALHNALQLGKGIA